MFPTLVLLCTPAQPPKFTVENKCPPQFIVVSKLPGADRDGGTGDLPNRPAPAGYEFKRYQGQPWRLYPIATTPAPAVAATNPFLVSGCGCTAGANCGAAICKSHGGTGCPASCPVRK